MFISRKSGEAKSVVFGGGLNSPIGGLSPQFPLVLAPTRKPVKVNLIIRQLLTSFCTNVVVFESRFIMSTKPLPTADICICGRVCVSVCVCVWRLPRRPLWSFSLLNGTWGNFKPIGSNSIISVCWGFAVHVLYNSLHSKSTIKAIVDSRLGPDGRTTLSWAKLSCNRCSSFICYVTRMRVIVASTLSCRGPQTVPNTISGISDHCSSTPVVAFESQGITSYKCFTMTLCLDGTGVRPTHITP